MHNVANAKYCLALATLMASHPLIAAEERASAWLEWNRSAEAAECLDAAALSATVEAGLNRTVFVPEAKADLRIKVYLDRPDQDQWTAAIDLEDPNGKKLGHRELRTHAPQCSAIEESLALVVSLMVDVTRESVKPKPATIQHVTRVENEGIAQQTAKNPANSVHESLFILGSIRVGQLPGLGRGISVAGELGPPRGWFVLVSATGWAPAQTSENNSGAKFTLASADLSLCGAAESSGHLEHSLCVGQQIGWLDSHAFGFDVNQRNSAILYDLTFRLRTTWWASAAFGLHLGVGLGLPLVQNEFFGTLANGTSVTLLSRPLLVPMVEFGFGVRNAS